MVKQHVNATTTPEIREFIARSDLPTALLARLLKISEPTVRKWRNRTSTEDSSHKPHNIKTTLTLEQEFVIVELRTCFLLPLDQLLNVCKEHLNPNASRSGLQRLLTRHGISNLSKTSQIELHKLAKPIYVDLLNEQTKQKVSTQISPKSFETVLNKNTQKLNEQDPFDVVQVKVISLPDHSHKLLMANDLHSKWVYVDLYSDHNMAAASRYMSHVLNQAPFHIRRLLAANYKEFLSRFQILDENAKEINLE